MTARTPTGETPFRLTYGADAVIPAEIGLTSYMVQSYMEDKNEEAMRLQLDLVDEVRAIAKQRLASPAIACRATRRTKTKKLCAYS